MVQDKLGTGLNQWVVVLLFLLNALTVIVTIYKVYYLYTELPKAVNSTALSVQGVATRNPLDNDLSVHRKSIERYFYLVAVIPMFVSFISHYGARFPQQSLYIYPAMTLFIGIAYLMFIKMMIISCDGLENLKNILRYQEDECMSCKDKKCYKKCCKRLCCKVFLRKDAYRGLIQRIWLCSLVLAKPCLNYTSLFLRHFESPEAEQYIGALIKVLTVCTSIIPMQVMKSLYCTLLPHSRLQRPEVKMTYVSILAPMVQLQDSIVSLLFGSVGGLGLGDIDGKDQTTVIYGIILGIEMLIFSFFIVKYAFNPNDLRLWSYSKSLMEP